MNPWECKGSCPTLRVAIRAPSVRGKLCVRGFRCCPDANAMTTALTNYKILTRDLTRTIDRLSADPQTQREVNYYRANIGKIKSIEEFLGNDRVFNFAMKAFGLGDMSYAKGMMRKALSDGIDDQKAFSVRMADPRFREFVTTFNFQRYGSATTSFDRTQQGTIDRYLRSELEETAGETSEAVRLALYFDRKAPELLSNYSILADKALLTVVRTALGLPASLSSTDLEKQAKIIGEKINVDDLKDAAKRQDFIARFLVLYDVSNNSGATDASITLLSGTSSVIGQETLLSIQSLRRG